MKLIAIFIVLIIENVFADNLNGQAQMGQYDPQQSMYGMSPYNQLQAAMSPNGLTASQVQGSIPPQSQPKDLSMVSGKSFPPQMYGQSQMFGPSLGQSQMFGQQQLFPGSIQQQGFPFSLGLDSFDPFAFRRAYGRRFLSPSAMAAAASSAAILGSALLGQPPMIAQPQIYASTPVIASTPIITSAPMIAPAPMYSSYDVYADGMSKY